MSLATFLAVADPSLTQVENRTVTLTSPIILDFALCRDFWKIEKQARDPEMKVIIDLEKTVSIRNSGYALLWMVRERLAKDQANLLLIGCRPYLKKALQLRGFEPYFTLL